MSELDWALRSVRDAPRGPSVGAFFDLDGTLVAGFTAVAFFREFVRREGIAAGDLWRIARAAIAHRRAPDNGQGIIEEGVSLMKGRPLEELEAHAARVFKKRIARTIRAQGRALVQAHRDAGHTLVVASAATPFQARRVAEDLGIPHLLTTRVEVVDGRLTGRLDGAPLWGAAKARAVESFAEAHDIDLGASFAYGNGREDRRFLHTVGHPVAVSPDPGLAEVARTEGIPVLSLEDPPRAGLRGVARTLAAIGAFNGGLASTVAVSAVVGQRAALRLGSGPTVDMALGAAGVRVRAQGQEHIEAARPAVFVFNHQSNLDPLLVAKLVPPRLHGGGQAGGRRRSPHRAVHPLHGHGADRSQRPRVGPRQRGGPRGAHPRRRVGVHRPRGHAHAHADAGSVQAGGVPPGRRCGGADRARGHPQTPGSCGRQAPSASRPGWWTSACCLRCRPMAGPMTTSVGMPTPSGGASPRSSSGGRRRDGAHSGVRHAVSRRSR